MKRGKKQQNLKLPANNTFIIRTATLTTEVLLLKRRLRKANNNSTKEKGEGVRHIDSPGNRFDQYNSYSPTTTRATI